MLMKSLSLVAFLAAPAVASADDCSHYATRATYLDWAETAALCRSSHISNHATHYNNCMTMGVVNARETVEKPRLSALNRCINIFPSMRDCGDYAAFGELAGKTQAALQCGFAGDRWTTNFQAHMDFCSSQTDLTFARSEHEARRQGVLSCLRRFQPPR